MTSEVRQVSNPVDIPFWCKREGFIARECGRCGHRGVFDIFEDPIMVSDNILCLACGTITFSLVVDDPTGETIEEIVEAGNEEEDLGSS